MIYFYFAHLDQEVHAQALGFTKTHCGFVEADAQQSAESAVRRHYGSLHIGVTRISLSIALQQCRNRYVFPEQILHHHDYASPSNQHPLTP